MCHFALAKAPSSYPDLRYTDVIEQSNEYTCGASAVATLLTYYYGISTAESAVLELVYAAMRAQGESPTEGEGLTAYDLKEALAAKGVPSKGFLVEPAALPCLQQAGLSSPQQARKYPVDFC